MFLWLKTLYRKRAVTWPFIFYTIIWTLSIIDLLKKAAKEIAKLVAKYAFKIASPAGAAASLIWSFGRCMWF